VPQNGIIGPQTRRAIQMFQGQQQLPVTGLLDSNTVNAIQGACSGQTGGPGAAGPGPSAPPTPPPGPPDAGGAPGAGAAPPDAGEAEIASAEAEQETEQEFRVDGPCQVQIDWHDPVPMAKDEHFRWAPDSPAVYVVYVGGKPWHVTIAEHNLRHHLLHRAKALRDLNIPLTTLTNRSVGWASLRAGAVPRCAIQHRQSQADPTVPFRPIHAKHGILRLLKRYFVKKFQTENKGNRGSETVQIGPNGSLTIFDKGKLTATLASGSQV
jgi:Putative peptidoglycan binding domain